MSVSIRFERAKVYQNEPVHRQLFLVTRLDGARLGQALDDLDRPVELCINSMSLHALPLSFTSCRLMPLPPRRSRFGAITTSFGGKSENLRSAPAPFRLWKDRRPQKDFDTSSSSNL